MNRKNLKIKSFKDNTLQGKTFLLAIFCCVRCILFPGTKVIIASGTRGQSLNILEKIKIELFPRSPLLQNEVEELKLSASNAYVLFKNGSSIKVVTASDSARGNNICYATKS